MGHPTSVSSSEAVLARLLAITEELRRRNNLIAGLGEQRWHASEDMPPLTVALAEVQPYLGDTTILRLVEELAAYGRRCGIEVQHFGPVPAVADLGGSVFLRDFLDWPSRP